MHIYMHLCIDIDVCEEQAPRPSCDIEYTSRAVSALSLEAGSDMQETLLEIRKIRKKSEKINQICCK